MENVLKDFVDASARSLFFRNLARFYKRYNSPASYALESLAPGQSLFTELDVAKKIKELDDMGISMGLSLPKTYTADIIDFSLNSPCRRWLTQDSEEQNFSYREISKGRLPDGRQAVIADIVEPMRCKSISLVAADPKLLEIATGYLGFVPTKANTRLWWSIKEEGLDDIGELKKLYHKVDMFHYDYGYQYIYVYFYLTPTNANSGAHVVIKNTHKKKYFRQFFSSRYHSDGSVVRTFPKHSWTIVEGGVGDGFIEDPNCLHKGMMPKKKDRLILQVRYT